MSKVLVPVTIYNGEIRLNSYELSDVKIKAFIHELQQLGLDCEQGESLCG